MFFEIAFCKDMAGLLKRSVSSAGTKWEMKRTEQAQKNDTPALNKDS